MKKFKFNIGDVVIHRVEKDDKLVSAKYLVIGRALLETESIPQGDELYLITRTRIDNSIMRLYVSVYEISKYNG